MSGCVKKLEPGVYNELEVLRFSHIDNNGNARFLCRCSCGKTWAAHGGRIRAGITKRCPTCTLRRSRTRETYGNIPGSYWHNLKNCATQRKIPFKLSIKEAWELFEAQNGLCALSETPLSFKKQTASLDRKDSQRGYTSTNVQWVHKTINRLKMDLSEEELLKWCKKIVRVSKYKAK